MSSTVTEASALDVPAIVLGLVLAETAIGGLALLWLAPTWGHVRHGYEVLQLATLGLMALGAWASLKGPLDFAPVDAASAAGWASDGLLVVSIGAGVGSLLILIRQSFAARIVGIATALLGLATLVPLAVVRDARGLPGGVAQGIAELAFGSLLLGAVWTGMILGHWYLVERGLSNRYMVWMSWANVGAVVAGGLAVWLSSRNPVPCAGLDAGQLAECRFAFSPLLSRGEGLTVLMGFGVLAILAIIAGFNVRLAREGGRSIQASTGMYYLAVILAPAAEFAAKVRFF